MSSPFQKQFSSKSPLNELKRGEAGFQTRSSRKIL